MKKLLAFFVGMSISLSALAEPKDPLSYPLKQYGLMLGTALLGGLVAWAAKVRAGTVKAWNLMALIGELCTSAFAGLLCFWFCESLSFPPLMTAALVGVAGHMGSRAITAFESMAQRKWGVSEAPAATTTPGEPK